MKKPYKIGILYIALGKYIQFWSEFYNSFQNNFLPGSNKEYFVFTDDKELMEQHPNNVHVIKQKDLGWPGDTLYRFDMFLKVEEELKTFDYVFFMNANLKCEKTITEEEFLPRDDQLVVVRHPGFWGLPSYRFAYERNNQSQAYIPYYSLKGTGYFAGGLNGGGAQAYLQMIRTLAKRIQIDDANGVLVIWHDESHLNWYIAHQKDYKILSPSYCYPEGWDIPFEIKILVLDKEKYIPLSTSKIEEGTKQKELSALQIKFLKVFERIKRKRNRIING